MTGLAYPGSGQPGQVAGIQPGRQEINEGYATLTAFIDQLFRSAADRLPGLERVPGSGRG